MQIPISVVSNDALAIQTDVLVLKYAQHLFGVDRLIANRLAKLHTNLMDSLPKFGDFVHFDTFGTLGAKEVLFTGVETISQFSYQNIREFTHRSLAHLSKTSPQVENVCFTVHGVYYGLDEIESFESEIAGIVDALSQGEFPQKLKQITIVEIDEDRASRLNQALIELFPQGAVIINKGVLAEGKTSASDRLKEVGYSSETKPLIFVAMPFDKKMYDVFHYGISGAVNKAGFLCERADEAYFTGDIIERVKMRIRQADLVIADLTQANANVYLEVGYAWGCDKQTVLLIQDSNELKFDVKGQRCLVYSGIKELEELLQKELENIPIKTK